MRQIGLGLSRVAALVGKFSAASMLVATLCPPLTSQAASLDPAVEQRVRAATFEIVIPKPVDDPLTYEKPLPMDLLPFTIRNDKYFSIGTGFCIGPIFMRQPDT